MSRRIPLVVAALALTVAAPTATAVAQAPGSAAGTVVAVGSGTVTPTPDDRKSNTSIAKAVGDAQSEALPLAIKAARTRAQVLAKESGLTLGALVGISDAPASPFFGSPFGETGTFGPGRFCGTVQRFRTTRLANGGIRRKRIGTRRLCRVPNRVATTVTVTFATTSSA